jgi:hypothetical protein
LKLRRDKNLDLEVGEGDYLDDEGPNDGVDGGESQYLKDATEAVRKGFARKVFCLLAIQMAVTVGIITLFLYHGKSFLNHPCNRFAS